MEAEVATFHLQATFPLLAQTTPLITPPLAPLYVGKQFSGWTVAGRAWTEWKLCGESEEEESEAKAEKEK